MTKLSMCANCFKSLGVASRMNIYSYLLEKQSATVLEIVDHMKLTQPTVSYHLLGMKKQGMVKSIKKGKEVIYSLGDGCPFHGNTCVLENIKLHSHNAS